MLIRLINTEMQPVGEIYPDIIPCRKDIIEHKQIMYKVIWREIYENGEIRLIVSPL